MVRDVLVTAVTDPHMPLQYCMVLLPHILHVLNNLYNICILHLLLTWDLARRMKNDFKHKVVVVTGATGGPAAGSAEAALQELRALASFAKTSRLIGRREEQIIVNAADLAELIDDLFSRDSTGRLGAGRD